MDVKLIRQVFDKDKFNETVDTEFSQLRSVPDPSFFDINLATIDDFWALYEDFFFDIPPLGPTKSHEYLSRTSGEYANIDAESEDIQALLDEIAALRLENLELRGLKLEQESAEEEPNNKPKKELVEKLKELEVERKVDLENVKLKSKKNLTASSSRSKITSKSNKSVVNRVNSKSTTRRKRP
jgi:predicted metal-dependent hydrolase